MLDCEFVPTSDPGPGKLLVVLHGRGDSSAGFRWMPDAMALPGLSYLLVNAPDAYFGGRSWYDLPPDQAPGVERSRQLLAQLFGEILAAGWNAQDVALLGFSQGCLMTLEFGARTPLELRCYVGVSGYCLDPDKLLAEMHPAAQRDAWLITHGRFDEALPFERTEQQAQQLRDGGLPVSFRAYDKGHTIDPTEELQDIRRFVANHLRLQID